MLISYFKEDRDYEDMCKAWIHYGWTPCPVDALPKTGFVALDEDDGRFLGYMGAYAMDENMAHVEWAVRNPDAGLVESVKAMHSLWILIVRTAEEKGVKYLYSATANKAWGDTLESYGMTPGETNTTAYIQALNGGSVDFMK